MSIAYIYMCGNISIYNKGTPNNGVNINGIDAKIWTMPILIFHKI